MSEWICFQTCRWFSGKINLMIFPNLSFIIVSVLTHLLIDFGLFYLLVSHMGRHMSEHYCLNQAWIKHTFTPTEGETSHKLQLFLFTIVCFHSTICICQGQRLCLCRASSVCGCRWVSKALQLNIRRTMSDEAWLARVMCVCGPSAQM